MLFYLFLYFLAGYVVVRVAHHKIERVPNIGVAIFGMLLWPIVGIIVLFYIKKDWLIGKIFGA